MIVEVLNVSRAADGYSNENVASIQFGRIIPKNDPRYQAFENRGIIPSFMTLVLFYKFEDATPYKVGSKWNLEVSENGALKLEEVT
jgi:hypothetical protein